VDYGKAHSERCNHERYGEDFTGRALIEKFSSEDKINLLGHSFGGATIRLFADIMEDGSKEEIAATPSAELSGYFKGGKGDWIYSLTSLAAPHNGTTAYNVGESEPEEKAAEPKKNPVKDKFGSIGDKLMSQFTGGEKDGRIDSDYAAYDMYIDNALKLNETITTYFDTYYFSFACTASVKNKDGVYVPEKKIMESIYASSSEAMGKYTGTTKGGFVIDESWQENDGLVNTVSALAPSGAPSTLFEEGNTVKGVWNIMPIYHGDHMSLQGGMTKINDVKAFYVEHLSMINSL
jgi:triacylglycerol lipase